MQFMTIFFLINISKIDRNYDPYYAVCLCLCITIKVIQKKIVP
jgi:hypothetical protein